MQIKEAIVIGAVAFAGAMFVQYAQAQSTGPTMPFTITDNGNGTATVSPQWVNPSSGNQGGGTLTTSGGTTTFQPNWIKP